mmetsp:Transcript_17251/g.41190  ORF Transcript_17251/g.41190 Transcript_17251/m.41190 type:complete len:206 (-) Transcript_17251:904-1521(-)
MGDVFDEMPGVGGGGWGHDRRTAAREGGREDCLHVRCLLGGIGHQVGLPMGCVPEDAAGNGPLVQHPQQRPRGPRSFGCRCCHHAADYPEGSCKVRGAHPERDGERSEVTRGRGRVEGPQERRVPRAAQMPAAQHAGRVWPSDLSGVLLDTLVWRLWVPIAGRAGSAAVDAARPLHAAVDRRGLHERVPVLVYDALHARMARSLP